MPVGVRWCRSVDLDRAGEQTDRSEPLGDLGDRLLCARAACSVVSGLVFPHQGLRMGVGGVAATKDCDPADVWASHQGCSAADVDDPENCIISVVQGPVHRTDIPGLGPAAGGDPE